ncbi:uncharacterized protein EI90DRAFT_3073063 [Cantharellus anzutake]|uniref:uncharacterized protein n=1 Tax=Cantharellus anzutake TaxID=1750568 RepID=UPI001908F734|nr:uncharacterized protein EI90DRAFT_3073063 [Cantharellus anzutake]KAF8325146.1 hypothetical protein EI90DRAFT_3073063 [Cantharellus anzutake]
MVLNRWMLIFFLSIVGNIIRKLGGTSWSRDIPRSLGSPKGPYPLSKNQEACSLGPLELCGSSPSNGAALALRLQDSQCS